MITRTLLRIYDWLYTHKYLRILLLVAILSASVLSALQLRFKEDIGDFLPNDAAYHQQIDIYRKVNGADKIFVVFRMKDSSQVDIDRITQAIRMFEHSAKTKGWTITARIDYKKLLDVADFVYNNAPLLMNESDYARISQRMNKDSIASWLQYDKELLLFPTGNILSQNIERDPLGLFTPILERLRKNETALHYELNDGYIFAPDNRFALVTLQTPYGSSETDKNSLLISQANHISKHIESRLKDVQIRITGAPVIAVNNAEQIKKDSIWAIGIAVSLILGLLVATLKRIRYLSLIALSLAFGWIIALGAISLISHEVSLIVLGIASVIIGIAVNYPLHFVSHLSHGRSPRKTLEEIAEPLVVGNITTVGAFCALIPLQSTALSHLGIFAAFMLVGTIIFVVLFVPHLCKPALNAFADNETRGETPQNTPFTPVYPRNKYLVTLLVAATLILGYFSFGTQFDTDMQHINYLTDSQKELLKELSSLRNEQPDTKQVYFAVTGRNIEDVLDRSTQAFPTQLIVSRRAQQQRIDRWNSFVAHHRPLLTEQLTAAALQNGFTRDAFSPFQKVIATRYRPQNLDFFAPLTENGLGNRIIGHTVVRVSSVPTAQADSIIAAFNKQNTVYHQAFDVQSMNSTIAVALSQNFNYIGWVCSAIVFAFLWLSFKRLKLALIAFLPMAVSWIWILGATHLLDIRFNLVNIILATFIFGQGDDYSIFMTEGLIYEHTHRRRMLAWYRRSIFISAAIMFIGMGSLVTARHPALRGLGEITIVGMAAVILLTYIIPPLLFGWFYGNKNRNTGR